MVRVSSTDASAPAWKKQVPVSFDQKTKTYRIWYYSSNGTSLVPKMSRWRFFRTEYIYVKVINLRYYIENAD